MKKSGVFEGNKLKSYGDVGTSRGDVGGMTYSTGRKQTGATKALTNTARGGFTPTVRQPSAATNGGIKTERPFAERVSRGLGTASPKSGSVQGTNLKLGMTGDIYATKNKGAFTAQSGAPKPGRPR